MRSNLLDVPKAVTKYQKQAGFVESQECIWSEADLLQILLIRHVRECCCM